MDEGYYNHRYAHQQQQQHNNNDAYYARPQQPRYRRPIPVQNAKPSGSAAPYLTTQNFGILVAILVIYFFQRKGSFVQANPSISNACCVGHDDHDVAVLSL